MGKNRDRFKKTRDSKGTFHAKMSSIKDRNGIWSSVREIFYKIEVGLALMIFFSPKTGSIAPKITSIFKVYLSSK